MAFLHFYKKAQMGFGMRRIMSLLLAFIFLELGLPPLLNRFDIGGSVGDIISLLYFEIPSTFHLALWILATIGGVALLWNAMIEKMPTGVESHLRMASLVGALALLTVGLIPILNGFGVIPFGLPAFAEIIQQVLFTVVSFLLLYGATKRF